MTSNGTESPNTSSHDPLYHDLLVTAQINILNNRAQPIRGRALLDTGCSMNFITERFAKSLGIKQGRCLVPIGALDTLTTTSRRYLTTTITSMKSTYQRKLTFLVIPTITSLVPNQLVDRSMPQIPKNLQLADPSFHMPGSIDILLNARPTLASVSIGRIKIYPTHDPDLLLQKTRFGWVIGGGGANLSIESSLISYDHNGNTSRSRPFLGNRRGTAHHTPFRSGTTM